MKTEELDKRPFAGPDSEIDTINPEKMPSQMGLLFCVDRQEALQAVFDFVERIRQEREAFTPVIFYLEKSMVDQKHPDVFWIDKKDFNFFGKKKIRLKNWLQSHSFDLLLALCSRIRRNAYVFLKKYKPN